MNKGCKSQNCRRAERGPEGGPAGSTPSDRCVLRSFGLPFLAPLLVSLLLLVSCSKPSALVIGFSVSTMREEVYSRMKEGLFDSADPDRATVIWVSAENNAARQRDQIESLITEGIDILVFQPVDSTLGQDSILQEARRKGVKLIAVDRLPGDSNVDLFIAADNFEAGRLQARHVAEKLQGKGNVAILKGDSGHSATKLITDGNLDVFSEYPDIKVIAERTNQRWSRDLAALATADFIGSFGERLDAIIANNSNMAMGAIQTLAAHGVLDGTIVVGADADEEACIAVLEGSLSADIDKQPYLVGKSVYLASLQLNAGTLTAGSFIENGTYRVPVQFTPVKLVTAANVKQLLQERVGDLVFQMKFKVR